MEGHRLCSFPQSGNSLCVRVVPSVQRSQPASEQPKLTAEWCVQQNKTSTQSRQKHTARGPPWHLLFCNFILTFMFFSPIRQLPQSVKGGGSTCASGAVQHQYLRQHSNILSLGKRNFKYRSSPWNRHCQAGAWANKATHTKFTQTPYDTQMVGSLQPFNQTLHNTVTT